MLTSSMICAKFSGCAKLVKEFIPHIILVNTEVAKLVIKW